MTSEPPPPDVLDSSGRIRRLVLALVLGMFAAGTVYGLTWGLARPDEIAGGYDGGSSSRAYQFVYYFTALAGGACFTIALVIQNRLAKRKWQRELLPNAKLRR